MKIINNKIIANKIKLKKIGLKKNIKIMEVIDNMSVKEYICVDNA